MPRRPGQRRDVQRTRRITHKTRHHLVVAIADVQQLAHAASRKLVNRRRRQTLAHKKIARADIDTRNRNALCIARLGTDSLRICLPLHRHNRPNRHALIRLQQRLIHQRAGRNHPRHRPRHQPLHRRRLHQLLTHRHPKTLHRQLPQVRLKLMKRHPRHRHARRPLRQRKPNGLAHRHRIIIKHLIKIPDAKQQNTPLIPLLEAVVLLHRRSFPRITSHGSALWAGHGGIASGWITRMQEVEPAVNSRAVPFESPRFWQFEVHVAKRGVRVAIAECHGRRREGEHEFHFDRGDAG